MRETSKEALLPKVTLLKSRNGLKKFEILGSLGAKRR
jgi:hypothetical protein